MNVMWLDSDLDEAAKAHPTKYKKLILEAGQCLCSALHINGLGDQSPYGRGYINHPISRWASESQENWFQLVDYMSALHDHFYGWTYDELKSIRESTVWRLYEDDLVHKTAAQLATANVEKCVEIVFPSLGLTARPKCVVDWCEEETVTETYRKYIACYKQHFDWFEWSAGEPEWVPEYERKYRQAYRKGQFAIHAD